MSNTKLKIIALTAMVIDHIGYFIPDMPDWFHWLGRLAAPIFIYCIIIGYKHTSSIKKYLVRLYVFAFGMSVMNMIINQIVHYYERREAIYVDYYLTNNFLAPLFLIGLLIMLLDQRQTKYLLYFFVWQIISTILSITLVEKYSLLSLNDLTATYMFFGTIFGNVLLTEGGILFIVLGILFYLTNKNKGVLAVGYLLFCLIIFVIPLKWRGGIGGGISNILFPFDDTQWLMIFALPLILLYNGNRGKGAKYFFYIFYPVHIVILYFIHLWMLNSTPI
ncbi:TraX family protein [Gracilibacillus lacisalsi]|uniref:TraX family protein n=1 Tax=Gracilibacillus lacisalsi TaxID=393087 RepID=UPI00036EE4A9|nr:TraX family protein [Gracilibacillus lacisalsi]